MSSNHPASRPPFDHLDPLHPAVAEARNVVATATIGFLADQDLIDDHAATLLAAGLGANSPVDSCVAAMGGAWLNLSRLGSVWLAGASRPLPPHGWLITDVSPDGDVICLTFRTHRRSGTATVVRVRCDAVRWWPLTGGGWS